MPVSMMTLHNVSYKINEPQKAQERQQIGSSFFFSLFLFSSFLFFFFFASLVDVYEKHSSIHVKWG